MNPFAFGGMRPLRPSWIRNYIRKFKEHDDRYGTFTVTAPLSLVTYAFIYVGCIAMDRQKELRWLRVQSISHRDLEMEEEREVLEDFLAKTEEDYEMKQPPNVNEM